MVSRASEKDIRNRLIILLLAGIGAYLLGQAVWQFKLPALFGTLLFAIALAISFIRGVEALYIVIFAMLFSPEIGSGLATARATGEGAGGVVIRVEDVVLVATGIGWILRSVYLGRQFGIVRTPVSGAIGYYMAASIVATLLGVMDGTVKLDTGFFHNLKYFEYFFLFVMILAHVRSSVYAKNMIVAMLVVFFLATIYGYIQMFQGLRVSAPFDAEPNTFGGYIVLMYCLAGGIILADTRPNVRMMLGALLVFAFPPFLFTLSRSSYLAMLGGLLSFLVVSTKRMAIFVITCGMAAVMMIGILSVPEKVEKRITDTFKQGTQYHVKIGGIDLDPSASARVISYRQALDLWIHKPMFGYGVTGTHFIDGQYVRILVETGVTGLLTFMLVFVYLLREVRKVYNKLQTPFLKGSALGFFCGIIAIMIHATTANSFIIVRIAEPFWLLAGLILLSPMLEAQEARDKEAAGKTPVTLLTPSQGVHV